MSELVIPNYQRRYDKERACVIAKEWTEELFVTPRVRPRPDGRYDVLDGQHTVGALKILGEQEVEVSLARVSDEEAAGLFADLNLKRRRLTPYETFRAERYAGRPLAVELDRLVARYGCVVSDDPGPNHLRCITYAYRILRKTKSGDNKQNYIDGPTLLDRTLRALTSAYRPSADRLSMQWVTGISRLIEALDRAKAFDDNDLIQRLRHSTFTAEGHKVNLTTANIGMAAEVQMAAGRIRLGASRAVGGGALYGATLAIVLYGVKRARELFPQDVR
jgi:hypothetical protein